MYNYYELIPPNLAAMGLKRIGDGVTADLHTVWKTPYSVLTRYKLLCSAMNVNPFAGGTYLKQGNKNKQGYITSGYRDKIMEGRQNSPHLHAIAIDVAVGELKHQIVWAKEADKLFTRVGLYPDRGFMHLDLVPITWIHKFSRMKKKYWVYMHGKYYYAPDFASVIEIAQKGSYV